MATQQVQRAGMELAAGSITAANEGQEHTMSGITTSGAFGASWYRRGIVGAAAVLTLGAAGIGLISMDRSGGRLSAADAPVSAIAAPAAPVTSERYRAMKDEQVARQLDRTEAVAAPAANAVTTSRAHEHYQQFKENQAAAVLDKVTLLPAPILHQRYRQFKELQVQHALDQAGVPTLDSRAPTLSPAQQRFGAMKEAQAEARAGD